MFTYDLSEYTNLYAAAGNDSASLYAKFPFLANSTDIEAALTTRFSGLDQATIDFLNPQGLTMNQMALAIIDWFDRFSDYATGTIPKVILDKVIFKYTVPLVDPDDSDTYGVDYAYHHPQRYAMDYPSTGFTFDEPGMWKIHIAEYSAGSPRTISVILNNDQMYFAKDYNKTGPDSYGVDSYFIADPNWREFKDGILTPGEYPSTGDPSWYWESFSGSQFEIPNPPDGVDYSIGDKDVAFRYWHQYYTAISPLESNGSLPVGYDGVWYDNLDVDRFGTIGGPIYPVNGAYFFHADASPGGLYMDIFRDIPDWRNCGSITSAHSWVNDAFAYYDANNFKYSFEELMSIHLDFNVVNGSIVVNGVKEIRNYDYFRYGATNPEQGTDKDYRIHKYGMFDAGAFEPRTYFINETDQITSTWYKFKLIVDNYYDYTQAQIDALDKPRIELVPNSLYTTFGGSYGNNFDAMDTVFDRSSLFLPFTPDYWDGSSFWLMSGDYNVAHAGSGLENLQISKIVCSPFDREPKKLESITPYSTNFYTFGVIAPNLSFNTPVLNDSEFFYYATTGQSVTYNRSLKPFNPYSVPEVYITYVNLDKGSEEIRIHIPTALSFVGTTINFKIIDSLSNVVWENTSYYYEPNDFRHVIAFINGRYGPNPAYSPGLNATGDVTLTPGETYTVRATVTNGYGSKQAETTYTVASTPVVSVTNLSVVTGEGLITGKVQNQDSIIIDIVGSDASSYQITPMVIETFSNNSVENCYNWVADLSSLSLDKNKDYTFTVTATNTNGSTVVEEYYNPTFVSVYISNFSSTDISGFVINQETITMTIEGTDQSSYTPPVIVTGTSWTADLTGITFTEGVEYFVSVTATAGWCVDNAYITSTPIIVAITSFNMCAGLEELKFLQAGFDNVTVVITGSDLSSQPTTFYNIVGDLYAADLTTLSFTDGVDYTATVTATGDPGTSFDELTKTYHNIIISADFFKPDYGDAVLSGNIANQYVSSLTIQGSDGSVYSDVPIVINSQIWNADLSDIVFVDGVTYTATIIGSADTCNKSDFISATSKSPTLPYPQSVIVGFNRPSIKHTTRSMKSNIVSSGAMRYTFEFNYAPMHIDDAQHLISLIELYKGKSTPFYIPIPLGSVTSTVKADLASRGYPWGLSALGEAIIKVRLQDDYISYTTDGSQLVTIKLKYIEEVN